MRSLGARPTASVMSGPLLINVPVKKKFLKVTIEEDGSPWNEQGSEMLDKVITDLNNDILDSILFESTLRVPVDTGQLRDSAVINYEEKSITYQATYAVFVHEGTGLWGPFGKKYEIKPREAKALKFLWPNAPPGAIAMLKGVAPTDWQKKVKGVRKKTVKGTSGYEFTLTRVMHPGQKGKPFLKDAVEKVVPVFSALFARERIRMHFGKTRKKTTRGSEIK